MPVAVLRLSGIYGPGRNAFVNLTGERPSAWSRQDQVFNRIRVEDIGAATLFSGAAQTAGIFNITDDEPGPPQDVVTLAARLMGVEPPPEMPFETAELTPMARSFYGENKRVSNRKMKALRLQFRLSRLPMSLADLWKCGNWRAEMALCRHNRCESIYRFINAISVASFY